MMRQGRLFAQAPALFLAGFAAAGTQGVLPRLAAFRTFGSAAVRRRQPGLQAKALLFVEQILAGCLCLLSRHATGRIAGLGAVFCLFRGLCQARQRGTGQQAA